MYTIPAAHKVDGYKLGHISQYVPHTEYVGANMTPRNDKYARVLAKNYDGKMIFMGLQMALKSMQCGWKDTFFNLPKKQVINAYKRRIKNYLGTSNGDAQIEAMGKLHDLGHLPLKVKALPEGARVNMLVPIFTVTNTHEDFFWLTNYMETYLSCMVWPMCNAISVSDQYLRNSKAWAEVTGADEMWTGIANHCFAARGHRGDQDSMMSGMAHLAAGNLGSDTVWAIDGLEMFYNANSDEELVACSVNAFEHATATQRIAYYGSERESVRLALTEVYPAGILSYVADSNDYFRFIDEDMFALKEEILARTADADGLPAKFVARPDSSPKTPLEIICGDPEAEFGSLEWRGTLRILWHNFGGEINDMGYKVLDPHVGVIYGEAISLEMQDAIYLKMAEMGFCVSNVLFGIGSWSFLEMSSRDSYGMAIKGTNSVVAGKEVSMQKDPKTSSFSKKSAKGLLRVEIEGGNYVLYDEQTPEQEQQGELTTVFENGTLKNECSLQDIRDRVTAK
jgi:nicotinamide phosphoribosyltransferase